MTPTIVLKDGKPVLALGSPGGPTIINTVLEVIVNVLDFGMNVQDAVNWPRFHHQWMPDELRMEPGILAGHRGAAGKARLHREARQRAGRSGGHPVEQWMARRRARSHEPKARRKDTDRLDEPRTLHASASSTTA